MTKAQFAISIADQRKLLKTLTYFTKSPAIKEHSSAQNSCLLRSAEWGAIHIDYDLLQKTLKAGAAELKADKVLITAAGRELLTHLKAMLANAACKTPQTHNPILQTALISGQPHAVFVNITESPLSMLYRLNKQSGKRFLSDQEFEAGERLRADFTRGNLLPNITACWDAVSIKHTRGQRGGSGEISDYAMDSRARVDKALKAVGPELSGLLLDICCFLKGLELVERERSWPARSAKMMLKTALSILHRHYVSGRKSGQNHSSGQHPDKYHWGDTDYRPSL